MTDPEPISERLHLVEEVPLAASLAGHLARTNVDLADFERDAWRVISHQSERLDAMASEVACMRREQLAILVVGISGPLLTWFFAGR